MQQPDEAAWVHAARSGDRVAFAALVDRYWDRIHRWLFALTGHAHFAEDLTQDVFLKAWLNLPDLRADSHFRAWLFRIARNMAVNARKGPRGVPSTPLPRLAMSRDTGPLTAVLEIEGQTLLQVALGRLPTVYRAAFLLWTHEELPYAELSAILDVSEVTARWRVCKAREFLLRELKPFLEDRSS